MDCRGGRQDPLRLTRAQALRLSQDSVIHLNSLPAGDRQAHDHQQELQVHRPRDSGGPGRQRP